jgi:hypothetical protein
MQFREIRGGIAESMKTVVKLRSRDELVEHCKKLFAFYVSELEISAYCLERDNRIGWDCTYTVEVKGFGILGFTDEGFADEES